VNRVGELRVLRVDDEEVVHQTVGENQVRRQGAAGFLVKPFGRRERDRLLAEIARDS